MVAGGVLFLDLVLLVGGVGMDVGSLWCQVYCVSQRPYSSAELSLGPLLVGTILWTTIVNQVIEWLDYLDQTVYAGSKYELFDTVII